MYVQYSTFIFTSMYPKKSTLNKLFNRHVYHHTFALVKMSRSPCKSINAISKGLRYILISLFLSIKEDFRYRLTCNLHEISMLPISSS